MSTVQLRTATELDAESIRALLEQCGLPTSDLAAARPELVVACQGAQVVATGALQHLGGVALLRSIAVAPTYRNSRLGRILVMELERRARAAGVIEIVLLTQTAARFFQQQGYCTIDRNDVPQAVQATEEFRSLCSDSAICMSKPL